MSQQIQLNQEQSKTLALIGQHGLVNTSILMSQTGLSFSDMNTILNFLWDNQLIGRRANGLKEPHWHLVNNTEALLKQIRDTKIVHGRTKEFERAKESVYQYMKAKKWNPKTAKRLAYIFKVGYPGMKRRLDALVADGKLKSESVRLRHCKRPVRIYSVIQ